jgi:hypothetical protein
VAYGKFRFLSEKEMLNLDYMKVDDEAPTGYIIEADLRYPSHLHPIHSDYPLAAESLMTEEMLSPYCKLKFEACGFSKTYS